ncbi:MAG TPA: hypothetical protein VHP60_01995, partial [Thermoanaerobaculia bacterium]|nr:hypothetical protein [Thermoanaerobaculia bacterium]
AASHANSRRSGSTAESSPTAMRTISIRPARQTCRVCGEIAGRAPGSWLRLCPRCGDALTVSGGDDLDVLKVVFEETVPAGGAHS